MGEQLELAQWLQWRAKIEEFNMDSKAEYSA